MSIDVLRWPVDRDRSIRTVDARHRETGGSRCRDHDARRIARRPIGPRFRARPRLRAVSSAAPRVRRAPSRRGRPTVLADPARTSAFAFPRCARQDACAASSHIAGVASARGANRCSRSRSMSAVSSLRLDERRRAHEPAEEFDIRAHADDLVLRQRRAHASRWPRRASRRAR